MSWQFSSQQPIYQQIADAIAMRILNGTYARGERLPSVRDLAVIASVNPNTMQRALSELESMELISTQRTSGRFVTVDETVIEKARNAKAEQICETFWMQMRKLGMSHEQVLCVLNENEHKEEQDGIHS
ncbi:MAG: GntR family transcriptional regulator [Clostridia bacterium]